MNNKYSLKMYFSNVCNYRCDYCTINKDDKQQIPPKDLYFFLNKNKNNIDKYVKILGGEPTIFLTEEYMNIINIFFDNILINTNFSNIDFIEKNKINKKIKYIVSYNGIKDDSNKSGGKILEFIKKYKSQIESISYLLNNKTMLDLEDALKFCKENDIYLDLMVQFSYNGINEKLNKEKLDMILNDLYKNKLLEYINQFHNFLFHKDFTCDCMNKMLTISFDGNIYPCPPSSNIFNEKTDNLIGNINNVELYNLDINKYIKKYNYNEFCKDCYLCEGKCGFYNIYDKITKENTCLLSKMLYEKAIKYKNNILLPERITVLTTEECNMACKYCFEKTHIKSKKKFMDFDTLKKVYEILEYNKTDEIKTIQLFGGEPTLNKELIYKFSDYLKNKSKKGNGIKIEIQTNGLSISDELINNLKIINEHSCLSVIVSLDGCKECHNENRIDKNGKGTWDKILKNIKKLRNEMPYIYITMHCVIAKNTIKYLKNIIENYEDLKTNYFNNIFIVLCDPDMDSKEDKIAKEDLEYIFEYYYKNIYKKNIEKDDFYKDLVDAFAMFGCSLHSYIHEINTCGAGNRILSIRPDGTIIPCHKYIELNNSNYLYENINIEECNKTIYIKENYKWKKYKQLENDYTIKLDEECLNCPFKGYCSTCLASNEILGTDLYKRSKKVCERTKMIGELMIKYRKIAAKEHKISLIKQQNEMIEKIKEKSIELGYDTLKINEQINKLVKGDK